MLKRISFIFISLFILTGLIFYLYVWVYDASKPNGVIARYSIDHLKDELNLLKPISKEQQFEKTIKNGNHKFILVINISKIKEFTLKEQFNLAIEKQLVSYNEFGTTPKITVVIKNWYYSYIKYSFDYINNSGNRYMDIYGKKAAKGQPNYRYFIEILVEKGNTRYFVRAFCNSPNFLDDVITEFVNQTNSLE